MLRPAFVVMHRFLGLAIAGFLFLSGLTGAVISWDHELDEWLNPHLFEVASRGDYLPALSHAERVERADPRSWVTYIPLHAEPGHSVVLGVEPRVDPATGRLYEIGYNEVFLDPATGSTVGQREWGKPGLDREHLIPFLYEFHYSLHIPEFWGIDHWGIWLMGSIALIWAMDCFVGFYLTLPAGGAMRSRARRWWARWRPAWAVKWRGSRYRISFDIHRAFSLWLWVFLFILAVSAASLNLYREAAQPIVTLFSSFTPTPFDTREERPKHQPIEPKIAFNRILALAQAEALRRGWTEPAGDIFYSPLYGVYGVSFFQPGDDHGAAGVGPASLYFDGGDGRYLGDEIPWRGTAGDLFLQIQFPLHSGRIAGLPGRIFISAMGLVVATISVTGVIIWYRKRRARLASRPRRQRSLSPAE